jgi:hypothetical protein
MLDGEIGSQDTATRSVVDLMLPNGTRLRLLQSAADRRDGHGSGKGIAHIEIGRDDEAFGSADLEKAAVLSRRLGVSVHLRRSRGFGASTVALSPRHRPRRRAQ